MGLKILLVTANYAPEPTGIGHYTTGLAEGLAVRGHGVTVLTGFPYYPQWRMIRERGQRRQSEDLNGVRVKRFKFYVPANPRLFKRAIMEVSFAIRVVTAHWKRPDVVICVSPPLITSAACFIRAGLFHKRARRILWSQDLYGIGLKETRQATGAVASAVTRLEFALASFADTVVVIHEKFEEYFGACEFASERNQRLLKIPNWSHTERSPDQDKAPARIARGWALDIAIVLHAGNMGLKQGLENVVHAARLAHARNAPIKFVLLGDGNQRNYLADMATGIPSLQLLAPVDEDQFAMLLAAADILLLNEADGIESMAVPSKLTSYFEAGRPVLAATNRSSAAASEIDKSGGGIIVAPGDPDALLEAAEELFLNKDLSVQLGENGREYARRDLSPESAISRFEEAILEN